MKITIHNHTNIEKKLNSYNKSFENYSKTLINLPIPSSDTRNHYFNIKENKGVGICSVCKNENLYLKEYVAYYQKLGIKKLLFMIIMTLMVKSQKMFYKILSKVILLKF